MTYHEQEKIKLTLKLQELIKKLPSFCNLYFIGIEYKKTPRTKLCYASELLSFFEYIEEYNPNYSHLKISDFPIDILNNITVIDIENYLSYIKCYVKNNKVRTNEKNSIKRKLSVLRSFYSYYYVRQKIVLNPTLQVEMPKIDEKNIVRLDMKEVSQLLDMIDTNKNIPFRPSLKTRNLALIMLLLGTGIRVSECVGLDIKDIDYKNNCIKIVRKGGSEDIVYLSDEVKDILITYYKERVYKVSQPGHEQAFFLSAQGTRLCVRSIQKMVVKYSDQILPMKKITPHRLRSTYGTNLYQVTKDIYIVAKILGHKDVNTTKRHYADILDEDKKAIRNQLKLR